MKNRVSLVTFAKIWLNGRNVEFFGYVRLVTSLTLPLFIIYLKFLIKSIFAITVTDLDLKVRLV